MGQDVRSPRGPRCIALVGPFQSGKTTLLEAILARTGAVQRQGTVEAGTTVGDGSPEMRTVLKPSTSSGSASARNDVR